MKPNYQQQSPIKLNGDGSKNYADCLAKAAEFISLSEWSPFGYDTDGNHLVICLLCGIEHQAGAPMKRHYDGCNYPSIEAAIYEAAEQAEL